MRGSDSGQVPVTRHGEVLAYRVSEMFMLSDQLRTVRILFHAVGDDIVQK